MKIIIERAEQERLETLLFSLHCILM